MNVAAVTMALKTLSCVLRQVLYLITLTPTKQTREKPKRKRHRCERFHLTAVFSEAAISVQIEQVKKKVLKVMLGE